MSGGLTMDERTSSLSIVDFDDDVLFNIFLHLPASALGVLSQVCRVLHEAVQSPYVWEEFCKLHGVIREQSELAQTMSWQELYIAHKTCRVWSWGSGSFGRLGLGRTHSVSKPTLIKSLLGDAIVAGACGSAHSVLLTLGGNVLSFGSGFYGQLGDGGRDDQLVPTPYDIMMGSTVRIVAVACGEYFTVIASEAGEVYTFGVGNHGQLGLGRSVTSHTAPTKVIFPPEEILKLEDLEGDEEGEEEGEEEEEEEEEDLMMLCSLVSPQCDDNCNNNSNSNSSGKNIRGGGGGGGAKKSNAKQTNVAFFSPCTPLQVGEECDDDEDDKRRKSSSCSSLYPPPLSSSSSTFSWFPKCSCRCHFLGDDEEDERILSEKENGRARKGNVVREEEEEEEEEEEKETLSEIMLGRLPSSASTVTAENGAENGGEDSNEPISNVVNGKDQPLIDDGKRQKKGEDDLEDGNLFLLEEDDDGKEEEEEELNGVKDSSQQVPKGGLHTSNSSNSIASSCYSTGTNNRICDEDNVLLEEEEEETKSSTTTAAAATRGRSNAVGREDDLLCKNLQVTKDREYQEEEEDTEEDEDKKRKYRWATMSKAAYLISRRRNRAFCSPSDRRRSAGLVELPCCCSYCARNCVMDVGCGGGPHSSSARTSKYSSILSPTTAGCCIHSSNTASSSGVYNYSDNNSNNNNGTSSTCYGGGGGGGGNLRNVPAAASFSGGGAMSPGSPLRHINSDSLSSPGGLSSAATMPSSLRFTAHYNTVRTSSSSSSSGASTLFVGADSDTAAVARSLSTCSTSSSSFPALVASRNSVLPSMYPGAAKREKTRKKHSHRALHDFPRIVNVAAGSAHVVVAAAGGGVYAWGCSRNGKLGLGGPLGDNCWEPRRVKSLDRSQVTHVACGREHSGVLDSRGQMWTWGSGNFGNLGHGPGVSAEFSPRVVDAMLPYKVHAMTMGDAHSMCLTSEGYVFTCGYGGDGALGHGCLTDEYFPKFVNSLSPYRILRIFSGMQHNYAVSENDWFGWGTAVDGNLGFDEVRERRLSSGGWGGGVERVSSENLAALLGGGGGGSGNSPQHQQQQQQQQQHISSSAAVAIPGTISTNSGHLTHSSSYNNNLSTSAGAGGGCGGSQMGVVTVPTKMPRLGGGGGVPLFVACGWNHSVAVSGDQL